MQWFPLFILIFSQTVSYHRICLCYLNFLENLPSVISNFYINHVFDFIIHLFFLGLEHFTLYFLDPLLLNECATCSQRRDQHLLAKCDTCSLYYHLDCLNPPLTRLPKKSKLYGWQCSECDKSSDSEVEEMNAPRRSKSRYSREAKSDPECLTPIIKIKPLELCNNPKIVIRYCQTIIKCASS